MFGASHQMVRADCVEAWVSHNGVYVHSRLWMGNANVPLLTISAYDQDTHQYPWSGTLAHFMMFRDGKAFVHYAATKELEKLKHG